MIERKGWGPWREDWYSICSAHRKTRDDCIACHCGTWVNAWGAAIGRVFYRATPRLWQWWANR